MAILYFRKLTTEQKEKFEAGAGSRNLSQTEYLVALMQLHEGLREVLDDRDVTPKRAMDEVERLVQRLKLGSIVR